MTGLKSDTLEEPKLRWRGSPIRFVEDYENLLGSTWMPSGRSKYT